MISLLVCLLLISINDIREKKIPNSLVIAIYLIGLLNLISGRVSNACLDLSGRVSNAEQIVGLLFIPLIILCIMTITKYKIGMGDIKLISAIGFGLGLWNQMIIILIGFGLALVTMKKEKTIALGPFISIGVLITLIIC